MDKLKYTTYLAGPIEHATKDEMINPREDITKELYGYKEVGIYDPIKQESEKVGKESGEQVKYIQGLKKAGRYEQFFHNMWSIWFGQINENSDIIQVLQHLRMTKHIHGNTKAEFNCWGDAEAVVRSDFIIVYLPDTKTVGTHWELFLAALFRIPAYVILPDRSKTEANSTMLFGVMLSGGEVFYKIKDCTDHIKEKYNLVK